MPKKVLLAYYSQSGQVREILDKFMEPFSDKELYELYFHEIKPKNDFPFPWTSDQFFDAFPESVLEEGCELEPMPFHLKQDYDLIVLGYQIWYLSPSIPITAFLKSNDFKTIAKNKPVITVNACRNMWFMAQKSIRNYLQEAHAKYTGHLVWFDTRNNLISVITIMHWAFTARKDKKWGFLPKPGVKDADIERSHIFGELLKEYWEKDKLEQLQTAYVKNKGVEVLPHLMSMETKAKRIFKIWTKLVRAKGEAGNPARLPRLRFFKYYLLFMIYFLSPIATLVFYVSYPLFFLRIRRQIQFYQSVK